MSKFFIQAYLEGVMRTIDEQGWAIQGVTKSLGKPGKYAPPYVYSIGRPYRKLPMVELVVLGLPIETGAKLVNDVLSLTVKQGLTLKDGFVFTKLANFPIKLKQLKPSQVAATCVITRRLNPEFKSIEFFQLVWPDAKGFYPGEEGFDRRFIHDQDIDLLERTMSSPTTQLKESP